MTEKATGRIIRSISGFYDVQIGSEVINCRARGILRKQGNSPLTGDMVEITMERGKGMVEKILPRKNSFVRPAVANVDALVVFAANVNPVTEPFLIDRVAAIAGDQNVQVILCVNKCDLDPAVDLVRIYTNAGFPVISTSAETGEGVEALRQMIAGKLTAFTGNSGVGKSSILNRLSPELALPTGEVSEKLGRGGKEPILPGDVDVYELFECIVPDMYGELRYEDYFELIRKVRIENGNILFEVGAYCTLDGEENWCIHENFTKDDLVNEYGEKAVKFHLECLLASFEDEEILKLNKMILRP